MGSQVSEVWGGTRCKAHCRLPTLGDWGRIIDWRAVQLAKLPGVEVITGRRLSPFARAVRT